MKPPAVSCWRDDLRVVLGTLFQRQSVFIPATARIILSVVSFLFQFWHGVLLLGITAHFYFQLLLLRLEFIDAAEKLTQLGEDSFIVLSGSQIFLGILSRICVDPDF